MSVVSIVELLLYNCGSRSMSPYLHCIFSSIT